MNPLSQEQLNAMVNAGAGVQPQATSGDTSGALSKEQLDAMVNAGLSHSQSAALLGHSTGLTTRTLSDGAFQPTNSFENIKDLGIGALKSVGDTALGAAQMGEGIANQTAGRVVNAIQGKGFNPLSNEQLGNDVSNPQSQISKTSDSLLASKNDAQGAGKFLGNVAQALVPVGNIAKGGIATESIVGKAGSAIGKGASQLMDSTGITKFLADRAASKATNAVASTAETMTKGERQAAIAEGRLVPTVTGGGKYVASETEQNAGKILSGNLEKNPVKNVPIIQGEIATRGKAAETFLEQNAKPISNAEDFNAFSTKRTEMAKYSTPTEMKAYDEQINMFEKQVLGRGGNNTANYYKALKEYETNVTSKLAKGKEALLTETGSAKLQAAKDVRSVVRDMVGEKNPEFKPQMYDLASLYDALDNTISKAENVGTFAKRHPVIDKTLKYGAEAIGAGALYEGAKKIGVPLPL